MLGENRDVVTFDDIQIQVVGEMATASAFMRFTNVSAQGEELRYLENRITWVAVKKGEAWKIIHQHTSAPVSFETTKVILRTINVYLLIFLYPLRVDRLDSVGSIRYIRL